MLVDASRSICVTNAFHMFLIYSEKKGYKQIMTLSKILLSDKGNILKGDKCAMNQSIAKCKLNR